MLTTTTAAIASQQKTESVYWPRLTFCLLLLSSLDTSLSFAFPACSIQPPSSRSRSQQKRHCSTATRSDALFVVSRRRQQPKCWTSVHLLKKHDDNDTALGDEEGNLANNNNTDRLSPIGGVWRTTQALATFLAAYYVHLAVLSQHVAVIANRWAVGYDVITGIGVALAYFLSVGTGGVARRRRRNTSTTTTIASALFKQQNETAAAALSTPWTRFSTLLTAICLVLGYAATGRLAMFWEDMVWEWSAMGWPITQGVGRALQVLLGHLSWTAVAGSLLLLWGWQQRQRRPTSPITSWWQPASSSPSSSSSSSSRSTTSLRWILGGFAVTSTVFRLADGWNRWMLPTAIWDAAPLSVVSQLVAPEQNDVVAMLLGCIAPCITAPLLEEWLYRGFALSVLTSLTGRPALANWLQSFVFAAHHNSITGFVPLWAIGYLWGEIYTRSRSLFVVTAIHSMWNARVFISSWLGLYY